MFEVRHDRRKNLVAKFVVDNLHFSISVHAHHGKCGSQIDADG